MIIGNNNPTWVYNIYEIDHKEYQWFESGYWRSNRKKIQSSLSWEEATYVIRKMELVPKDWKYDYRKPDKVKWVYSGSYRLKPDYRNRRLVWYITKNIEIVRDREWWCLSRSELEVGRAKGENEFLEKHKKLNDKYQREPLLKILLKEILLEMPLIEIDIESVYLYCGINPEVVFQSAEINIDQEKKKQLRVMIKILSLFFKDLKDCSIIKKIILRKMDKGEIFRYLSGAISYDPDEMHNFIHSGLANPADELLRKLAKEIYK